MTHQQTMLKLQLDHELERRRADSADINTVNETMRVELQNALNETWYQKGWRPANGFAVALGSFCGVIGACWLCYLAIARKAPTALNAIPQLATSIALILGVPGAPSESQPGTAARCSGRKSTPSTVSEARRSHRRLGHADLTTVGPLGRMSPRDIFAGDEPTRQVSL
jgi:hypothetical protein